MGLFDRFKRKQETHGLQGQSTIFLPEPLEVEHGSEEKNNKRVDKVYFYGLKNIDGKILMSVGIEEGGIESDMYPPEYFIEPHYTQDKNGNIIEDTEAYYRAMAVPPKKGGDRAKFNAVKGFFQPRDITYDKIGSNYIGGVVFSKELGQYRRKYDENFRSKYIEKQKTLTTNTPQDIRKHDEVLKKGKELEGIYNAMKAGRASPAEEARYYANVKHSDHHNRSLLEPDDRANRTNR